MIEALINSSLTTTSFSTSRDKNGIHTVMSLMFPEIIVNGKSLDEAVTAMIEQLRNNEQYRMKVLCS